jgi:hypothetical protein
MVIWLEGGGVITNSYPDAKTAKDALDSFEYNERGGLDYEKVFYALLR